MASAANRIRRSIERQFGKAAVQVTDLRLSGESRNADAGKWAVGRITKCTFRDPFSQSITPTSISRRDREQAPPWLEAIQHPFQNLAGFGGTATHQASEIDNAIEAPGRIRQIDDVAHCELC